MRTCPKCGKVYSNDLFFCLDDGSRLRDGAVDPTAPTEVAYDVGTSMPTEIIPAHRTTPVTNPDYAPPPAAEHRSTLPYIAIGVLAAACLGLAGTLIVLNLDKFRPSGGGVSNTSLQIANANLVSSPPPANTAIPSSERSRSPEKMTQSFDPSGKWTGSWSTASGTLFDFDLTLARDNNALSGSIRWTMRRTARSDKSDKIGHSANEFVRGTYDPLTGVVNLSGYSKDDPDDVLVMVDVYKLQISGEGRKLTGAARNGGKWNGKVDLGR
jgi:hypothetical protein